MPNHQSPRAGRFARTFGSVTTHALVTTALSVACAATLVACPTTLFAQTVSTPSRQCDEGASWIARPLADFATRLAIARAGLVGRGVAGDVAARARATAWLPHVSARAGRGLSASASSSGGLSSSDRASESEALSFEVRVVFALDRAFWSPVELDAERIEAQRAERRRAIEREVLDVLVVLEQHRLAVCSSNGTNGDGGAVVLRARAQIEAATGLAVGELRRRAGR